MEEENPNLELARGKNKRKRFYIFEDQVKLSIRTHGRYEREGREGLKERYGSRYKGKRLCATKREQTGISGGKGRSNHGRGAKIKRKESELDYE